MEGEGEGEGGKAMGRAGDKLERCGMRQEQLLR